jgi:hypothetical protein
VNPNAREGVADLFKFERFDDGDYQLHDMSFLAVLISRRLNGNFPARKERAPRGSVSA